MPTEIDFVARFCLGHLIHHPQYDVNALILFLRCVPSACMILSSISMTGPAEFWIVITAMESGNGQAALILTSMLSFLLRLGVQWSDTCQMLALIDPVHTHMFEASCVRVRIALEPTCVVHHVFHMLTKQWSSNRGSISSESVVRRLEIDGRRFAIQVFFESTPYTCCTLGRPKTYHQ